MYKERNQEHTHRYTDHSHRNKARLDKVPRLGRRYNRTYHKANNGESQVILNHVDVKRTRHILVHKHKHLSQSPEHRKSNNRCTQCGNTPAKTQMLFHILYVDIRIFILDLGDHKASHSTKYANTRQNPGNHNRFRRKAMNRRIGLERFQINQVHPHHGKPGGANDATQTKNLQERIRKAQVTDSEHFFKDAILGCTMHSKAAAQSNRQPESHTRAITSDKHRLGNHKPGHKQRRARKHLVLRKLIGEKARKKHHQNVWGQEEYLQHERLPGLSRFHIGKRTRQDFLGIDKHAHLHKSHRKDRQKVSNSTFSFPHKKTSI